MPDEGSLITGGTIMRSLTFLLMGLILACSPAIALVQGSACGKSDGLLA